MVVGELTQERELIIIGGGPGGYHAAIRAAQLGLQVTLIEKNELGGVCLNKGCIPSKIHTQAAKHLTSIPRFSNMGIETGFAKFDITTLQSYKQKTVLQLKKGIEALCKANKIEIIKGEATFISSNKLGVENGHQYETYSFLHAIIATGGVLSPLVTIDEVDVLDSFSIFQLEELPTSLVIYGSDYISLEVATSFQTFGCEVTILVEEGKDDFSFDSSINKELKRILKKNKIKVFKSSKILNVERSVEGKTLFFESNTKIESASFSHIFITSKTKPNVLNLGLERAGIPTTSEGYIKVNKQGQTINPAIYAIGDVTDGPATAVKAIKQGKVAAESIAKIETEVDLQFMPTVIQSLPPIAFVGLSEEQALENGYKVKVGQFPLGSNGFSTISGEKDGFVKVISGEETDLLLGVHIIGNGAIELISTGITALEMVGREEDLLFPSYPHPSINEALLESIEALKDKAIHVTPKRDRERIKH